MYTRSTASVCPGPGPGCGGLTGGSVPCVGEEAGRDSIRGARGAGHDAGAGHRTAAQAAGPAAAGVHPRPGGGGEL